MSKFTIYYKKVKDRIYTEEDFNKIKTCIVCNKNKESKFFYRKPALVDGFDKKCKACRNIISDEWEQSVRSKDYRKNRYYLKNYGITLEQADELIKKADSKCEICFGNINSFKRKLHIDHCHKTGKIRGMLCDNCNKALGLMKDSTINLNNAINYLQRSNKDG